MTFQAEQHALYKCVQRGFTGFILAVDHIHPVLKGDVLVVKLAEAVNVQTQYLHGFSSFHPWSEAVR